MRPDTRLGRRICAWLLAIPSLTGCLPYVVGVEPHTVPKGQSRVTASMYVLSGREQHADSVDMGGVGTILTYRLGITDRTDVGVRLDAPSSMGMSLRHMLLGSSRTDVAALSLELGAGETLLATSHWYATLSGALRRSGKVVPYAGVRYIGGKAVVDDSLPGAPAIGGFLGVRLGTGEAGFLPEVGVYRHPARLGQPARVVLVPSLNVTGLLSALNLGGWR